METVAARISSETIGGPLRHWPEQIQRQTDDGRATSSAVMLRPRGDVDADDGPELGRRA